MVNYRAYVLDDNGHILSRHEFTCDSDEQAITQARTFSNGQDIEVWERSRVIGTIPKAPSPPEA
jgi:hypothetical protein